MPSVPPFFVQANVAFDTLTSGTHIQNLAFNTNVVKGDLLFVYFSASVITILAGTPQPDTLTFNGVTDSQGNAWTVIVNNSATFTNGLGGASRQDNNYIFGMAYAFAQSSAACTAQVSWTGTGPNSKSIRINELEYANILAFNRVSSGFSTANPATIASLVSSEANEMYISGTAYSILGPTLTGSFSGLNWLSRISPGSPSWGPVNDCLQGAFPFDATTHLSAANPNLATYWSGTAVFTAKPFTDPANHNVFFNDYPQMTWMKNVCFLTRDYWDQALSTPYVGQLWPVPNTGGSKSGQTYPF